MPVKETKGPRKQQGKRSQVQRTQVQTEAAAGESGVDQFLWAHSRSIVAFLCVYAGLRILIFAAAFPIFNNVDEQWHLLAVRMYARGQWPGKDLPDVDPESAELFTVFGTPEYIHRQEQLERFFPAIPLYRLSPQDMARYARPRYQGWINSRNLEGQSAPLYYLVAAGWYRVGERLGVHDWELAYWVRLLNPAAYVLLMWAAYRLVKKLYPGQIFLWIGVPALLAVFPQDVYFGLNREVLSAPMAAVTLLLMAKALDEEGSRGWLVIVAAVLASLTFLVDVSNFVLYWAVGLTLWAWARKPSSRESASGQSATAGAKVGIVAGAVVASLVFPLAWMLRNYRVMGDLTGSRAKIAKLGWTMKPWSEVFHHPMFSFSGAWYFLTSLTQTFWRGEYSWHSEPIRWVVADWLYVISSLVMVTAFTVQLVRTWKSRGVTQRLTECEGLLMIFTSILFMAAISLPFDYHKCVNPSREHPFFVSGRIISGALVPFALIYVAGLELLLKPVRKWLPAAALACLLVFITITEFEVRGAVFSSSYNYFALRAWQQGH